ncbi:MAG: hypothetical protein ACQERS_10650 [Bacteroidota bacterium]
MYNTCPEGNKVPLRGFAGGPDAPFGRSGSSLQTLRSGSSIRSDRGQGKKLRAQSAGLRASTSLDLVMNEDRRSTV